MMKTLLLVLLIAVASSRTFSPSQPSQHTYDFMMHAHQLLSSQDRHLAQKSPACVACHSVFEAISRIPHRNLLKVLYFIGAKYCTYKKIQDAEVCKGAVDEMTNYILVNAWARYMDPHSACHKIKMCPKEYQILNLVDYAQSVLADKPNKTQENPTNRKILKVLHMTDLHPDLFYEAGTPAVCNQPVCCRTNVKASKSSPAGYWGSNAECDIPLRTINLFLDQVKNQSIDMVIWTGDNTAHDIWQQSQQYNLNFTIILTDLIKKKLKVPVVPSLGNHESYPVNVYEWGKGNSIELNEGVAETWGEWIGETAKKTLKEFGYFSVFLKQFNLKVISLNTQAGNDENWVLLKNPTDPGHHLEWLQKQLIASEKNKQFVYIIGHIPPSDNLDAWGSRYNILIDRFNYIIRGQFFGHTHNDHMSFFTALNDTTKRIINNYMVAPSLTTSTDRNPRYRILKVDLDTMRVVDFDQFKLELRKNYTKDVIPRFEEDYSLLKEYGMSGFTFADQEKFRDRLDKDSATQIKYTFHEYGGIKAGTSGKNIGCSTRTTRTLIAECNGGAYKPSTFQKVAGPWKKLID